MSKKYHSILLPSRPQTDTIAAIFVLKRFGRERFPGIEDAGYEFRPTLDEGETEESLEKAGLLPIDIGGGKFDHHKREPQTTATSLIAEFLGEKNNPALSRLIKFIERDEFHGKGIISTDQIDRAFGLPGLMSCLNKKYKDNPEKVFEIILPIIEAYYEEEERRAIGMPKELEEKLASGKATPFEFRQKDKKFKGIFIETDNASMPGFLRSRLGGEFDAVALSLSSGHINILTSPRRNVDLRSLAVLVRMQEAEARGVELEGSPEDLAITGKINGVPNWYYDPATNSLLNGGQTPAGTEPTAIPAFDFLKLLEIGLSQRLWEPEGPNPHKIQG